MSPYRIACLGALVCTVVAWIDAEGEPMPRPSAAIAGTDRQPYHAPSPKEDATCRNLSAGSPVSSA